jgi:hypothetical protein
MPILISLNLPYPIDVKDSRGAPISYKLLIYTRIGLNLIV